jgi:hypothetical protein
MEHLGGALREHERSIKSGVEDKRQNQQILRAKRRLCMRTGCRRTRFS